MFTSRSIPIRRFFTDDAAPGGGGGGSQAPEADESKVEDVTEDDDDEEADEGEHVDTGKLLERLRKKNSENRALRQRTKDAEDKAKTADDAEQRAKALEAENLRYKVALDNGIPSTIAKRLVGSTEEELLADAQALMEALGPKAPPSRQPREKGQAQRFGTQAVDEETDLDKIASSMFRN